MITLCKQVAFCASHYYWLEQWSEERNLAFFAGCANRAGHGHNYLVDVCLQGPVDPETGMVINFFDLLPVLHHAIIEPMDHKLLNEQVAFFQDRLPTLENIALFIWSRLQPAIAQRRLTLHNIRVVENPELFVEYNGDPMPLVRLTRQYTFSAAHKLWNERMSDVENEQCFGPCVRLHGHNYTLEVTVEASPDEETGMVMPLQDLDRLVQENILAWVDHRWLDEDVAFLKGTLSTVENVAQAFYRELNRHIASPQALYRIRLYESSQNWAEVTRDQMEVKSA